MTQTRAETLISIRPRPLRSLFRLLSSIRFDEVCALQGAPLIGASLSVGVLSTGHVLAIALVVAGNVCLVAHIFLFNDWSGIDGDLRDPNRAARTFSAKGASRTEVGYLAISLLAASLLLFGLIGWTSLFLALAIAGLGGLYSAPAFHWKGKPLLSSMLHFGGGALHFLLGYTTFAAVDARGLAISCFFGLVFTAGHFTHEARDREGDLLNGIRTNAVAFGKKRSLCIAGRARGIRFSAVHSDLCRGALSLASDCIVAGLARRPDLRKPGEAAEMLPGAFRHRRRRDDGECVAILINISIRRAEAAGDRSPCFP
jgi:4-hydroxybenzoate polyprenyltransferase